MVDVFIQSGQKIDSRDSWTMSSCSSQLACSARSSGVAILDLRFSGTVAFDLSLPCCRKGQVGDVGAAWTREGGLRSNPRKNRALVVASDLIFTHHPGVLLVYSLCIVKGGRTLSCSIVVLS